jgi:phasin family protein
MNLTEKIIEITADVRDQAGAYAARASEAAREGADRAAETVDSAKTPVETLADAGLALNNLAHTYFARLVRLQASAVKFGLDDAADRLRMLAKAESLPAAYQVQVKAFAGTRERILRDANVAVEIVTEAGRGVSELAVGTYTDLVRELQGKPPRARAKATARKPRRTAKRKATRARKAA